MQSYILKQQDEAVIEVLWFVLHLYLKQFPFRTSYWKAVKGSEVLFSLHLWEKAFVLNIGWDLHYFRIAKPT